MKKLTEVVEYLAESVMLEVKADIESGKITVEDGDECSQFAVPVQDAMIECLIKKLINKRMKKNLYGLPEIIIQTS